MEPRELIIESKTYGIFKTLIDEEDWDKVLKYKWGIKRNGTSDDRKNYRFYVYNSRVGLLHRFLNQTPAGMVTDHVDCNTLNNTRSNLRTCTTQENLRNRDAPSNNTSGYKGVRYYKWGKRRKRWEARISDDGTLRCLGCYHSKEEAARAYDKKAIELHGEFANLNFPKDKQ